MHVLNNQCLWCSALFCSVQCIHPLQTSDLTFLLLHSACIHKREIEIDFCPSETLIRQAIWIILQCIHATFTIIQVHVYMKVCVTGLDYRCCTSLWCHTHNVHYCVVSPQTSWWTCPVLSSLEMTHCMLCPVKCWRKHMPQWVEKHVVVFSCHW